MIILYIIGKESVNLNHTLSKTKAGLIFESIFSFTEVTQKPKSND